VAGWITAPLESDLPDGTNRLGLGLSVHGPVRGDEWLFGTVPSVWLQERLVDGSPHWYDAVAALVYSTHFVAIPVVTAAAWFWLRDHFAEWITAVLIFTVVGVGVYVVYPAAPPWMAAEYGQVGAVERISDIGWEWLRLDWVGALTTSGQSGSNPVAAMPSLHAGAALLIALSLWPVAGRMWRVVLGVYVLSMALTLVYTGEHYVVDALAGWLVAVVAVAGGAALRRRRAARARRDDA
jgi:membrane-associated phospholipid phosphatase